MKSFVLILALISPSLFALPTATVNRMRGKVFFDGNALSQGNEIKKSGKLETGAASFVRIKIKGWDSEITLGPKASMELTLDEKAKKKYVITKGSCRWISALKTAAVKKKKKKGAVYTPNAAMGVRGTDFYLKVNPVLGESEIVVLDGEVNFQSLTNKKDNAPIKKGQWGGLGGRYGTSIGKVLDLPPSVLKHFDSLLKFKN